MIEIIGVGDIMPGGVLSGIEQGYCSDDVLELLQCGDIRVGTLETAVGNAPTFSEEKMSRKKDVIYTLDKDLHKLKQLNIDVVSLANKTPCPSLNRHCPPCFSYSRRSRCFCPYPLSVLKSL